MDRQDHLPFLLPANNGKNYINNHCYIAATTRYF